MATLLTDEQYMARALELARHGAGFASPNPMVGCVVVAPDGRIIGEGWHRRCGEAHAEVNALASVSDADKHLLAASTLYVTLEPCAHYGKTPPCAELIVRTGVAKVVMASLDPFAKVAGRGAAMLREAGIEVKVGTLEDECRALNRRFMTAHTLRRPFIQLKWAMTADGFIANADGSPLKISNPLTLGMMHGERALADAIMVGTDTANIDNPRLNVRLRGGTNPRPITFNRYGRLNPDSHIAKNPDSIIITSDALLAEVVSDLYNSHGITSIMVEGGAKLLNAFIAENLWDEIRRETNTGLRIGTGIAAPELPADAVLNAAPRQVRENIIEYFTSRK